MSNENIANFVYYGKTPIRILFKPQPSLVIFSKYMKDNETQLISLYWGQRQQFSICRSICGTGA